MRLVATALIVGVLLALTDASAADVLTDNPRITELFDQDQADRKGFPNTKLSWKEINVRDEARREEVLSMLKRGEVRTAQDFFFSAVVFHHGQTNEHYRLATSLAWVAAAMEPENKHYLWLTASTWDRLMVKRGRPQWYGIQPKMNADGQLEGRHPIDEGVVTGAKIRWLAGRERRGETAAQESR